MCAEHCFQMGELGQVMINQPCERSDDLIRLHVSIHHIPCGKSDNRLIHKLNRMCILPTVHESINCSSKMNHLTRDLFEVHFHKETHGMLPTISTLKGMHQATAEGRCQSQITLIHLFEMLQCSPPLCTLLTTSNYSTVANNIRFKLQGLHFIKYCLSQDPLPCFGSRAHQGIATCEVRMHTA